MTLLASHPYYKVEREITSLEQKNVEYERMLYLYEDKLVTHRREFNTEHIFDMSYRWMSGEDSILYVHTSKGVFSYSIKDDPMDFIEAFKELEKRILKKQAEQYEQRRGL
ncbi:hypothetical protein [Alkalicoccus chagannorensis]|uniref:hypothetical protein n=1 Tax=Alkalicoccus chagannorensis TaxID=427072 RepID=UPI000409D739|nr:hypothetical protein [Alkalicoccus chagannorensis]